MLRLDDPVVVEVLDHLSSILVHQSQDVLAKVLSGLVELSVHRSLEDPHKQELQLLETAAEGVEGLDEAQSVDGHEERDEHADFPALGRLPLGELPESLETK